MPIKAKASAFAHKRDMLRVEHRQGKHTDGPVRRDGVGCPLCDWSKKASQ